MYDVLIAGYGPTGMMAAALLGRAGHKVAVLERYKTLYNLPRVGIVHDDVLRMFQEIGLAEAIAPATFFLPVYELGKHGEVLLSNDVEPHATHGWPEMTSIYQPSFEAELDRLDTSLPTVDVFKGLKVVGIAQDAGGVEVTVEDDAGAQRIIEGRWLIGADGGNSTVREALGVAYADLGFDQNWLVIDAAAKPGRPGLPLLRQFCEPEQPGMTMQMGPGHRRWSFMIFADEDPAEAVKHENVWRRLDRPEGGTPAEFELVRTVSYKFQSLDAEEWRVGRIFLAGDAAHQMPPFLAQGMCSGFRDAYNIAWKLDLVLKGLAAPAFLDSYAAERQPNARATIVESMRVGINVNERDPEKVKARDDQLRAMQAARAAQTEKALIAFRVPGFDDGFIAAAAAGAGDIFPQGTVRAGGREGRFDDVVGRGFMIIARGTDPAAALGPGDRALWQRLGGRLATIGAPASGAAIEDVDGVYARLMDGYGCDVLVKRPDYYLFGACAAADLPALLADLRRQLQGQDASTEAADGLAVRAAEAAPAARG
jgi:2-polyprenyl-6-methoxyphenol hydroxylase-like FAD-dependent oxidoreductase